MMRVPVEQGAFDPAETTQPELNYETAISLFYLEAGETAIQPLEYLLHQIDLSQVEDLEWSSWLLIPDFTVMDQGLVMSHLTRLVCLSQNSFYMESTLRCLAMNMTRLCHIEQFTQEELLKWRKYVLGEFERTDGYQDRTTERFRLLDGPEIPL